MLAHLEATYLGEDTMETKIDQKDIKYRHIALQNPDKKTQIMICRTDLNLDLSGLKESQKYLFIIDIPVVMQDKGKYKVLGVVPFSNDKQKDVKVEK